MIEDPRKTGLKSGLRQLTIQQLMRVLLWPHEMVLDTYNYEDGKFCPLAVGAGLCSMTEPTHEKVYNCLIGMGYKVYNTRGIEGEFYTTNRKEDLLSAAKEVLEEKKVEHFEREVQREIERATKWANNISNKLKGHLLDDVANDRLDAEAELLPVPKYFFRIENKTPDRHIEKIGLDPQSIRQYVRRRLRTMWLTEMSIISKEIK